VREAVRTRHYSIRTEEAYPRWVREYILLFDGAGALRARLRRILKVGRTIADLEASEDILPRHVAEAVGYRAPDRTCWA
jgi:predicted ATPase with chaperone activity